jgi:hypothetical protein
LEILIDKQGKIQHFWFLPELRQLLVTAAYGGA